MSKQDTRMEPSASVVTSCLQICDEMRLPYDNWKLYGPTTFNFYYASTKRMSTKLERLVTPFENLELDPHMSACLSHCEHAVQDLSNNWANLKEQGLRGPDTTLQEIIRSGPVDECLRQTIKQMHGNVTSIHYHLRPALALLHRDKTDTDFATTSGIEKLEPNRYRPPTQRKLPYASSSAATSGNLRPSIEQGAIANAQSDADSDSALTRQEHSHPISHTPELTEATGERPAHDPPAPKRTALLRRLPFCYLLAALAFIFISSSSAVGLYFSIAQNAMGDGFTTAGFILAVGTLVVTPPAAYHYQHCHCWRPDTKSVRSEGAA